MWLDMPPVKEPFLLRHVFLVLLICSSLVLVATLRPQRYFLYLFPLLLVMYSIVYYCIYPL